MPEQVLVIDNLSVDFVSRAKTTHAVRDVSFSVGPSEILTVVGESGSGKSVTALSIVRLLPTTARMSGSINLSGIDLGSLSEEGMRKVRGADIGMVFQDPMQALNPVFTIGWQVIEAIKLHQRYLNRAQLHKRARELLKRAGIADAERRLDQYPHELSGGLRQRVMIAIAIANDPKLLIADEATTALDVTVQAEILDLFRDLRDESGMSFLVITHNMGVVADVADRVVVMRDGRDVEVAAVDQLFAHPENKYTTELLASVPRFVPHPPGTRFGSSHASEIVPLILDDSETKDAEKLVLEVKDLVVEFGTRGSRFRAVDGVSLQIGHGEIVGLVGESGSGKSTVGRAAAGLYAAKSGSVSVLGEDLSKLGRRHLHEVRRRCAIVLQDPSSSLDPRMTVGQSIAEPMIINGLGSRYEREHRVARVLDSVRLGSGLASRYPHELSGGQRQRASIARALVLEPQLMIADEPTSSLDVSVQASVLDLFLDLQRDIGFACLFITHDLAVVSVLAHRVVIMSQGKVVEDGDTDQVFFAPRQLYTRRLVEAVPVPDPPEQRRRRMAMKLPRGSTDAALALDERGLGDLSI